MAQHTPLYIVASQHPRVGKTLVARLLIEYFRLSGRPIVGYDLDPREPALAAHFPSRVWPVDIADTQGQMALFDRLVADNWRTTSSISVTACASSFSRSCPRSASRRRGIVPIVLFITDSAPTTVRRYGELRARLPRTMFVPVDNEATSFMFIPNDFPPTRPECGAIRIPRLSPIVRGVIDRPGFSFAGYLGKRPGGPTEVHTWIDTIFSEFRELELRLLIGELESPLCGYATRRSAG